MEKREVWLHSANVSDYIFTGGEFLGSALFLVVVKGDESSNHFWAIFEGENGQLVGRKAIIDTIASTGMKGPNVKQDIYIGKRIYAIIGEVEKKIRLILNDSEDRNPYSENTVNVEMALQGESPSMWVVEDNQIEHLIELKRKYSTYPFSAALAIDPYETREGDTNPYSDQMDLVM